MECYFPGSGSRGGGSKKVKRKFFAYLHVSDHPLPRVVTAALVAAHVSVGAGMIHPAPPRLPAGVGAELTGVVVT